jgi:DNA-binding cell septation regulator SpoVG
MSTRTTTVAAFGPDPLDADAIASVVHLEAVTIDGAILELEAARTSWPASAAPGHGCFGFGSTACVAVSSALRKGEGKMADREFRVRSWVRGSDADIRDGLLGFISVFVGDLIVDGLTLRRTANGRLALSFPQRQSRSGQRHAIVRPVDDAARRSIEREILGQLGQRDEIGIATEEQS